MMLRCNSVERVPDLNLCLPAKSRYGQFAKDFSPIARNGNWSRRLRPGL